MKRLFLISITLLFSFACHVSHAAFEAKKIAAEAPPLIDGILNDAVWQDTPARQTFFTWSPRDAGPPPVNSAIQIAYDQKYLYIALKASDPDVSQISAPWVRRDLVGFEQDYFDVYIDPVGTGRFAQLFRISPKGQMTDGVFNESTGEIDFAPDFAFDGAAHITGGGWTAELRIPLSEIRYPANSSKWTMLVVRNYTREQRWRMSSSPLQWGDGCTLCKKEAVENLEALPSGLQSSYVLNGLYRQNKSDSDGQHSQEHKGTVGLDFKIRPLTSLILDGTVHPDFSQVESDAPQLRGNKKFALYFAERRPFFVEGSDLLSMKTDGNHAPRLAIYTRSITDLQWGVRATTRGEQLETLWLSALDQGGGTILLPGSYQTSYAAQPKSRVDIARARYSIGDLELGGFFSRRDYGSLGQNTVAGPELTARVMGGDKVYFRWLENATSAVSGEDDKLMRGTLQRGRTRRLQFEHYGEKIDVIGWYEDATPRFRADTGFFSQAGFRSAALELTARQGPVFKLSEFNLIATSSKTSDWNGKTIDAALGLGMFGAGHRDSEVRVMFYPRDLQRVGKDSALHSVRHAKLEVSSLPGRFLTSVGVQLDIGEQVDVANDRVTHGATMEFTMKARPLARLEIDAQVQWQLLSKRGTSRQNGPTLDDTSTQLVGIYHLGTQDFLRMIWVNGNTRRNVSSYLEESGVAASESTRTLSFAFAHRFNLRSTLYIGFGTQRKATNLAADIGRERDAYAKLSWEL